MSALRIIYDELKRRPSGSVIASSMLGQVSPIWDKFGNITGSVIPKSLAYQASKHGLTITGADYTTNRYTFVLSQP